MSVLAQRCRQNHQAITPPGFAKFDPALHDPIIVLSNSNATASDPSGGFFNAYGDTGASSGKVQIEYSIDADPSANIFVGVADKTNTSSYVNAGSPSGNPAGAVINGAGLRSSGQQLYNYTTGSHNSGGPFGFSTGQYVGITMDFTTGDINFYVNGGLTFSSVFPSGITFYPLVSLITGATVTLVQGSLNYPISGFSHF